MSIFYFNNFHLTEIINPMNSFYPTDVLSSFGNLTVFLLSLIGIPPCVLICNFFGFSIFSSYISCILSPQPLSSSSSIYSQFILFLGLFLFSLLLFTLSLFYPYIFFVITFFSNLLLRDLLSFL